MIKTVNKYIKFGDLKFRYKKYTRPTLKLIYEITNKDSNLSNIVYSDKIRERVSVLNIFRLHRCLSVLRIKWILGSLELSRFFYKSTLKLNPKFQI